MKDFKSFLIGFLMCTCMFLFMGQTKVKHSIGKYQVGGNAQHICLIDTETGETYKAELLFKNQGKGHWTRIIDKNQFKK